MSHVSVSEVLILRLTPLSAIVASNTTTQSLLVVHAGDSLRFDIDPTSPGVVRAKLMKLETTKIVKMGTIATRHYKTEGDFGKESRKKTCLVDMEVVSSLRWFELPVPANAAPSLAYGDFCTIGYTLNLQLANSTRADVPVTILGRVNVHPTPLSFTKDQRMVSCWCWNKGTLTVAVQGPSDSFFIGEDCNFTVTLSGAVKEVTRISVSVGSTAHVESYGALEVVPMRDEQRIDTFGSAQSVQMPRKNKKYPMSFPVPAHFCPEALGEIIRVYHTIELVINFGMSSSETIEVPVHFILANRVVA